MGVCACVFAPKKKKKKGFIFTFDTFDVINLHGMACTRLLAQGFVQKLVKQGHGWMEWREVRLRGVFLLDFVCCLDEGGGNEMKKKGKKKYRVGLV